MSTVEQQVVATSAGDYIVVLRAPSSARFVPEDGWELNLVVPSLALDAVRVRCYTRWVDDGPLSLPRELILELKGPAGSLDEAVTKFAMIARQVANMIGFVTNVLVGPPEVHLAYDASPAREERELLEVFIADERGAVTGGRTVRIDLLEAACLASLTLPTDSERINRALRHYELALRHWYVGGEWLALSYLWMAVENLTEAVLRKVKADRAITDEELAQSLAVVTDDPTRPRWRQIMREQVREQLIFGGDHQTYQTAKNASDGLEHGYLELTDVAAQALQSADTTFRQVRRTIINLLNLPTDIADELMTIQPLDVQSDRKIVRGRILGAAEDPAEEGELYPRLEWVSAPTSVVREGATFEIRSQEKLTVRVHPNLKFHFDSIEGVGRLQEGQVPVQIEPQDLTVEPATAAAATKLLDTVMPLAEAAIASGVETPQDRAHQWAFNLFGQGLAFFQSAQTLIASYQPIEALLSLRGLTLIAARFEQMVDPAGAGLGIAARLALDGIDEIGADAERTARARSNASADIEHLDINVPDELPDPAATAIYRSLTTEMTFARSMVAASYGAIGLHIKRPDDEHAEFHTKLEPGHFTDMVASACVIAQLELLKRAAELFGWTLDVPKVDDVLTVARELNEASANPSD